MIAQIQLFGPDDVNGDVSALVVELVCDTSWIRGGLGGLVTDGLVGANSLSVGLFTGALSLSEITIGEIKILSHCNITWKLTVRQWHDTHGNLAPNWSIALVIVTKSLLHFWYFRGSFFGRCKGSRRQIRWSLEGSYGIIRGRAWSQVDALRWVIYSVSSGRTIYRNVVWPWYRIWCWCKDLEKN